MLSTLNLNYFLSFKDTIYAQLTLEFLSSLIFSLAPNTNCSSGTVQFRLFNIEYAFTFAQLTDLLQLPHGNDIVSEVPDTEGWQHTFQPFWRAIIGTVTHSCEGNKATLIHNPAIRYFRQILACTIFGRSYSNKVNDKEFFYLFATFVPQKVNTFPSMFSHMQAIVNARRGPIGFGVLITFIAQVLGLEDKFSNLRPLPPRSIDIDMTRNMKLVKRRRDSKFHLMVANNVFQDCILSNPICTDMRNPESYCYIHDPVPDQVLAHILENVATGGGTDEDYVQEQVAPATETHPHTTHMSSENVTGTSFSQRPRRRNVVPATLYDIYAELLWCSELDAKRNQQIQNMEAQQTKMMQSFSRCSMTIMITLSGLNKTCLV